MNDILEIILGMIFIFIGIILFSFLIVWLILGTSYHFNNYPIEVTQEGVQIYSGTRACIDVQSSGDTTTIKVSKGYLCLFPKAVYTGRNIEVKPIEELAK